MSPVENTKKKILEVSLQLFSSKGFASTSVRDIANAADVNISAVNYHFGSKDKLYSAVLVDTKHFLKTHIDSLYYSQDEWSEVEYVEKISDLFHKFRARINATFKVILSDVKVDEETLFSDDNPSGPPGAEHLTEILIKQHNIEPSIADKISYITMSMVINKTAFLYACDQKGLKLPDQHSSWEYSKEITLFLISSLTKSAKG